MRILSPDQPNGANLSNSLLLDNVVIFPDGSVTWLTANPISSEMISTVACEIVPEEYSLPVEHLRLPQPQPPEIFVTEPEFTPMRILKSMRHL
ncbi:MAG: hypothetical protein KME11_20315 [Timaviella obliquedivisa GSE-PSE-MK23-08B]|jgi:hypothetical protein|nr:hypothetical protein [Timaviella obliquedivisa GSE-PSE-MK23-08B]